MVLPDGFPAQLRLSGTLSIRGLPAFPARVSLRVRFIQHPADLPTDGVDSVGALGGAGAAGQHHHAALCGGVVGDQVVDAVGAAGVVVGVTS